MKTISVASRKGGAGKTTLTAHLAVQAMTDGRVLIVDRDQQGSVSWWWKLRGAEDPSLIDPKAKASLPEIITAAEAGGFAWTIVDTPPHADLEIVEAVKTSDLTLIPCRPGPFDLAAVGATLDVVRAFKKPMLAVLMACPSHAGVGEPAVVREARDVLQNMGLTVARQTIGQRAAFSHAITSGQAVREFEPDSKAAREIARLWAEVQEKANA